MSIRGTVAKIKSFFTADKNVTAYAQEQSRLWLMATLDLLPKPFFLLDFGKNRISFSNAAARRMMGLDYAHHRSADIYGTDFSLFDLRGELISLTQLPSVRVLRGERINGEHYVLKTRAGRFQIKVFSEDIPSMYGQPAAALIIFQDVTALKNTENDLRYAQADLNEAVEIAQVGFWSVETTTMKTNLSSQLMKQFDIQPGEYDGRLDFVLAKIHEEDRPRVVSAINKSMVDGSAYHIEYRVVSRDGSVNWIEAKSGFTADKAADTTRFAGTTIDITEKIKARQNLEASERELRLLADSMPQVVWSANPDGELDYFNQVWFEFSGSTYEENRGSGWLKFVCPEDIPRTIETWKNSLASSRPYENEFRLRDRNGNYRWHVARARPIFDGADGAGGRIKKWYGANSDIHDQKLLAEKMEEARSSAERANAAKSQFLANMSHEIRTPLGAIMGFCELMKENGLGRVEREEYIAVIERNSTQLLRIIDDILDLSKVEAGMMLIENIEFSLPEALTDFSSLMGFRAREKGIRFSSKALTPLPSSVYSDPTRLRQILMNVVGNAIKFTDVGFVELRVRFESDILEFEIEDSGRGISTDQERNLFQPFTQADASTTRKYGGTGLGLVLTRGLAEALGGGFVLKQSEIGKGSTFVVRVKAKAAEGSKLYSGLGFETAPVRSLAGAGQLAGLRILLVEDSPDNQALISIFLNRAGAQVEIASDGDQGYKMALSSVYDVVLMDVQMPVMDGITAIKILRQHHYRGPVFALTAHAMKEERARCLQAGFSDFLSKPVIREDLINLILGVIQRD